MAASVNRIFCSPSVQFNLCKLLPRYVSRKSTCGRLDLSKCTRDFHLNNTPSACVSLQSEVSSKRSSKQQQQHQSRSFHSGNVRDVSTRNNFGFLKNLYSPLSSQQNDRSRNNDKLEVFSNSRYGTQVRFYSNESDEEERNRPQKLRRQMKLMDFQEIVWPSPFKTIRNYFFSFLISAYFDRTFSVKGFLNGAAQAVEFVSGRLANGDFDNLQGLVSEDALQEIRNNYADFDSTQKRFLSVNMNDVYIKFVYEIGMIFDDNTNQRFVEITAVFQGFPGFEDLKEESGADYFQHVKENQEKVFICNYRFIREFTKGIDSDWTINKLNHFNPIDVPVRF